MDLSILETGTVRTKDSLPYRTLPATYKTLTLLYSERPKLHGVLAVLRVIGLTKTANADADMDLYCDAGAKSRGDNKSSSPTFVQAR